MWRAAAIGGPFFVRSFLGERFAKPTTSVTITARAAYPHAAAECRSREDTVGDWWRFGSGGNAAEPGPSDFVARSECG